MHTHFFGQGRDLVLWQMWYLNLCVVYILLQFVLKDKSSGMDNVMYGSSFAESFYHAWGNVFPLLSLAFFLNHLWYAEPMSLNWYHSIMQIWRFSTKWVRMKNLSQFVISSSKGFLKKFSSVFSYHTWYCSRDHHLLSRRAVFYGCGLVPSRELLNLCGGLDVQFLLSTIDCPPKLRSTIMKRSKKKGKKCPDGMF